MPATLFRVINQQLLNRSILLDKIDRSQGNFSGYAQRAKQKLYVPYVNPLDTSVKGYVDLVPTDEILLHTRPKGVIAELVARGYCTLTAFSSSVTAAPVVTSAAHAAGDTVVGGTGFLSLSPDVSYVTLTNPGGSSQIFTDSQLAAQQLADLVALSNQIKLEYNAHAANGGGVWHTTADAVNAPVATANATDLATSITLLNILRTAYEAHRVLVGGGPVHAAADVVNVIAAPVATDILTAIALSNDIKAKFNAHRTQATVHALNDTVNAVTLINGDSISATQVKISDAIVTIGVPGVGWKVRVKANSKLSNIFTL